MPRSHETHRVTFLHAIYSPKGGIEGLMVELEERQVQLTLHHVPRQFELVASLDEGDELAVEIETEPPGRTGQPSFPLYRLVQASVVEADVREESEDDAASTGTVVRLNYALHGEPNGVVLDNGDFVYLRPEGMRQLPLRVGDEVRATGPARALQFGGGRAIEAHEVNGQSMGPARKRPRAASKKAPQGNKAGAHRGIHA